MTQNLQEAEAAPSEHQQPDRTQAWRSVAPALCCAQKQSTRLSPCRHLPEPSLPGPECVHSLQLLRVILTNQTLSPDSALAQFKPSLYGALKFFNLEKNLKHRLRNDPLLIGQNEQWKKANENDRMCICYRPAGTRPSRRYLRLRANIRKENPPQKEKMQVTMPSKSGMTVPFSDRPKRKCCVEGILSIPLKGR